MAALGPGLRAEQPGPRGGRRGRRARGPPQLRQDVRHVAVHGVRADHEALGDLRVAQARRDERENLPFPGAQLAERKKALMAETN